MQDAAITIQGSMRDAELFRPFRSGACRPPTTPPKSSKDSRSRSPDFQSFSPGVPAGSLSFSLVFTADR